MREINIKMWRNRQDNSWTAEINRKRHERVPIEWIQELVQRAVLDAEESLVGETETRLQ